MRQPGAQICRGVFRPPELKPGYKGNAGGLVAGTGGTMSLKLFVSLRVRLFGWWLAITIRRT